MDDEHPFGDDKRDLGAVLHDVYAGVIHASLFVSERTNSAGDGEDWRAAQEMLSTIYHDTRALYERLGIDIPESGG